MAGQITGKNAAVYLEGRDVSGDGNSVSISWSADAPETTAFKDTTRTRLGGLKDWSIDVAGFFNDTTGAWEHQLNSLLGGSSVLGVYPGGDSACKVGYEGESQVTDFSLDTPVDGVVTLSATFTGSGPLYRTYVTTACTSTCTSASSYSAGIDTGASSTGCPRGFLRVTAGSGAAPTLDVVVQHSADDAAYTDLIAFTQVIAGSTYQTKAASSARNRYIRAAYDVGGNDSQFTFLVSAT